MGRRESGEARGPVRGRRAGEWGSVRVRRTDRIWGPVDLNPPSTLPLTDHKLGHEVGVLILLAAHYSEHYRRVEGDVDVVLRLAALDGHVEHDVLLEVWGVSGHYQETGDGVNISRRA